MKQFSPTRILAALLVVICAFRESQAQTPLGAKTSAAAPGATAEVVVRLGDSPLAVANGRNYKKTGSLLTPEQQRQYVRDLDAKHSALLAQLTALGGKEVARLTKALNGVIVEIDPNKIDAIRELPGVISARLVGSYQMDLSETVPYIGASAVQAAGVDGTGVRVAVLDSGIDYTHRNLGGEGTVAAYQAAAGTELVDPKGLTTDGLFPTAKVIGGIDLVGEIWPFGPRRGDPDPIDRFGHGTHVADIIAGQSADGLHKGVAPGAKLYAVKVCSGLASSCNGVALLLGMEFAFDPNGDGDISDAVDVINMSLGSNYGQREDDLSAAAAIAMRAGIVVVCSAGNGGDRPYILGSPSSAPEVISVAQTQVPSAKRFPLVVNLPASIAGSYPNTETVDWAPIGAGFTGDVVYVGRGCSGDRYLNTNVAGKVVLIDRGSCTVSSKVDRAAKLGAKGVLLGLVAPGDAISFSYGGGDTFVPTLVITQADANRIKDALSNATVNVTVSPANAVPLVQSMVSSSSRGPTVSYNSIKPDIGAPGASVSADVGTGNHESAFGGTSGAAPMVAGSAALMIQVHPTWSSFAIKTALMNNAETGITTDPATQPGVPAPITRIGAGEVRVNRAIAATALAYDEETGGGSISFGYQSVAAPLLLKKRVAVRNLGAKGRTFSIKPGFRFASDAASGAVSVSTPPNVTVPASGTATFDVTLNINPAKLPIWNLNGGSLGGSGSLLQGVEFDGLIALSSGSEKIHVAWQVLPHRAADISFSPTSVNLVSATTNLTLKNGGAVAGRVEVFSLTGSSGVIKKRYLPQPGESFAVVDIKHVGVRLSGNNVQFAINTFGERAHPNYPAEFDIYIDSDGDGYADYVVFNSEVGGFGASGQNAVSVYRFADDTVLGQFFFSDADLNSANIVMTAPLSMLGLTPSSRFTFSIYAFDNYFTGNLTDYVENMTYKLDQPRFTGTGIPATGIPAGKSSKLSIGGVRGGNAASPSQTGLLLLYRDGQRGNEAATITIVP